MSPVWAPYTTSEALRVYAHADAIDKKTAFLIGTTIEYSNLLGIFFYELVSTIESPYKYFIKPI